MTLLASEYVGFGSWVIDYDVKSSPAHWSLLYVCPNVTVVSPLVILCEHWFCFYSRARFKVQSCPCRPCSCRYKQALLFLAGAERRTGYVLQSSI
jgi:hypothetical protein